jgi:glycosyltransferase involved in cell wall biosynthesis
VDGQDEPKQKPAAGKYHAGMASPAISVVIATYNRSRALAYAIESVLGQTFTNWELIVVGDACTDDTAEVVARYVEADARVRFVNLERNWGEQSAPNNIGRSLARAPLIAYLSHDDFWLPHHLKACGEALAATGADLVLGTSANISFASGRLAFDTLHVLLQGMGEDNRWSPADLDASVVAASCWLIRADALDKVGGWRMSWEDRAVPSQALLFRLWRRGFRIYTLNDLTLVIITAGTRPTSYLQRETPEHDWVAKYINNPAFASELAARMPSTNALADNRSPRRPPLWRRAIASILANIGIHPWVPLIGMRYAWRRGGYVRHLREFLSLERTDLRAAAPAVRAEAARRRGCGIAIGTPVDFCAGAGGARYLASGWSYPEGDGVWSDGPSASLMFDVGSPPAADLRFEFSLVVFQGEARTACEVGIETTRGQSIDRWRLSAPAGDWSIRIPASAWIGSRLDLRFSFDEAKSPSQLGLSADHRALSIKLRRVCIFRPSTE